jgi:hypothetical protein
MRVLAGDATGDALLEEESIGEMDRYLALFDERRNPCSG